jgi:hypothetical protein
VVVGRWCGSGLTGAEVEERVQVLYPRLKVCVEFFAINALHRAVTERRHNEGSGFKAVSMLAIGV